MSFLIKTKHPLHFTTNILCWKFKLFPITYASHIYIYIISMLIYNWTGLQYEIVDLNMSDSIPQSRMIMLPISLGA